MWCAKICSTFEVRYGTLFWQWKQDKMSRQNGGTLLRLDLLRSRSVDLLGFRSVCETRMTEFPYWYGLVWYGNTCNWTKRKFALLFHNYSNMYDPIMLMSYKIASFLSSRIVLFWLLVNSLHAIFMLFSNLHENTRTGQVLNRLGMLTTNFNLYRNKKQTVSKVARYGLYLILIQTSMSPPQINLKFMT